MGKFINALIRLKILRYDPFDQSMNSKRENSDHIFNKSPKYTLNPEKLKLSEKHFLSTFRTVTDIKWFGEGTAWGDIYKGSLRADPNDVFIAFLKADLIRKATANELIDADLNLVDIKNELKKRDIKSSGNKPVLIERLLESERDYRRLLKGRDVRYILTEKGRTIVNAYFDQEEKKKQRAIAKFKKEFHNGNLLLAEQAAISYRNKKALGGGLLGDDLEPSSRIPKLFEDIPPMIRNVEPEYLNFAREVSAADEAFGVEKIFSYDLLNTKTCIGLTIKQVALVFSKSMWYRAAIEKAKNDGLSKYFWINGKETACCDECKKLLGYYPIDKPIPVLPNEKCENFGLCNLSGMGVMDKYW